MAGRYPKQNWQSGTVLPPYGAISGTRLQHIEDWLATIFDDFDLHTGATNPHTQYLLAPGSPVTNGPVWWNGSLYVSSKLTKDHIDPAAGILKSQLAALGIVDADVTAISAGKITGLPTAIPAGVMAEFGGDVAPTGWILCDGSTYDGTVATYTALWNAIGVRYGGTGQSSFKVPDCRGRVSVGKGTHVDVDTVGKDDGTALALRRPKHSHAHTLSLPNHGHAVTDPGHAHSYLAPTVAAPQAGGGGAAKDGAGANTGTSVTNITVGNPTTNPAINGSIGQAGMPESAAYVVTQKIIKL